MLRAPAVAGMFYESDPDELREAMDACFLGPYGPGRLPLPAPIITRDIVGLVCPHAGYKFSGSAAAFAYFELAQDGIPDTVVLLGPSHRSARSPAAIVPDGAWLTPLGKTEIDSEAAHAAMEASSLLSIDESAHLLEHSLEVQLPFLQYLGPKTKIVPIILSVLVWEDVPLYAEELSRAIAHALDGKNAVVIASTDFTHYEPKIVAEKDDSEAIAAIKSMDYRKLVDVVATRQISMCGVVPTAVAIAACSILGGKRAELLSYYTSGDIIGEDDQVVGYGALKIVRT
ncbi:MAG: AmmeMemoRadiSam system protein B [Armatimonadetes bacterium]|nr:AmmeMemoRadiSam system protein B [Armatimonadota bacterium]